MRETQKFWTVPDNRTEAIEVLGFACEEPDAWWVPSLHYTMWKGKHLFGSAAEALAGARAECEEKIKALSERARKMAQGPV